MKHDDTKAAVKEMHVEIAALLDAILAELAELRRAVAELSEHDPRDEHREPPA